MNNFWKTKEQKFKQTWQDHHDFREKGCQTEMGANTIYSKQLVSITYCKLEENESVHLQLSIQKVEFGVITDCKRPFSSITRRIIIVSWYSRRFNEYSIVL